MKKIFTLAAAVLASFSLWAADPALETSNWADGDFGTVIADHDGIVLSTDASSFKGNLSGAQYIALGGGCDMSAPANYLAISADQVITAVEVFWAPNGTDNTSIAWAAWTDAANLLAQDVDFMDKTDSYTGEKKLESAIWQTIDLSGKDVKAILLTRQLKKAKLGGEQQSNFGDNKTVNVLGIRVYVGGAVTPSTDPVATVTLSGDAEAYVGETVTITATTDVKANAFQWLVNDAVQEGAEAAKFDFKADAAGTYSIVCKAKNDNNADWVASAALDIVVTEKTLVEQVEIDGPTVWDWTKAASVKEIKWTGEQKDAEPVLLANVEGMNNNQDFNSQALLFSGEYPVRDSKLCQGHTLIFKTKVAGYVQVVFSNTGTKDDPRYVAVNDVVNTEVGSLNSKAVESAFIPVEAGEVRINGAFADGTRQYLRIYKVTFGVGEIPTAIDNTEAAVKAVKVIRNGQLLIEKNGVLFNAQGAVVK